MPDLTPEQRAEQMLDAWFNEDREHRALAFDGHNDLVKRIATALRTVEAATWEAATKYIDHLEYMVGYTKVFRSHNESLCAICLKYRPCRRAAQQEET